MPWEMFILLSCSNFRCSNISYVNALGGVYTLNLSSCKNIRDVSALGGVHSLNLSSCSNIRNVSALGGVHSLNLSRCSYISISSILITRKMTLTNILMIDKKIDIIYYVQAPLRKE